MKARCLMGLLAAASLCLSCSPTLASQGSLPASMRPDASLAPESISLRLPSVDHEVLLAEDAARVAGPQRFAVPAEVFVTPSSDGSWVDLPSGESLWRFRVKSPGATDLNFGFGRFDIPDGSSLHVISADGTEWLGPYLSHHATAGELWTPILPGDDATLELRVPTEAKSGVFLELSSVGHGYRDLADRLDLLLPKSGACNNDVICAVGDGWREEIDSVALYSLDGGFTCTGTMIMDVPRSFRNWFLTADHCGLRAGNAASMVTYWNYQTDACAGPRNGPLADTTSGATFRATFRDSDFTLVELSADPDPAYNVYYAGWDRSDTPPPGSVAIHHPNLDEKAISFNDDALARVNNCIDGGNDTHWEVDNWEDGTTEPGSSGSGLWDIASHLLVGQLSGGGAACGNQRSDCYGRFGVGWEGGGNPASRLRDWLDPAGTSDTSVPGSYASASLRLVSHSTADTCNAGAGDANGSLEPGEDVSFQVRIAATGALTGIEGTLTSTHPGVTVVNGLATWPDLAAGEEADNNPSDFLIRLAEDIPCDDLLDFSLVLTADGAGPFPTSFDEVVGTPLQADLPVPIADDGPSSSELNVGIDQVISGLRVRVDADHSWIGDLSLSLRSPAGTEVVLIDRPGAPANRNGCRNDDMRVVFDDAAGGNLEDHCDGTAPWFEGDAQAMGQLADFDGESTLGPWTLLMNDAVQDDSGTLLDWELLLSPPLVGECIPCTLDCSGQPISPAELRVRKGSGTQVVLTHGPALSPCALGVQVRVADSPRPLNVAAPSFPTDPLYTDRSGEDLDPGPDFVHEPPAGTAYYLVVEDLPAGAAGPSGHYDR